MPELVEPDAARHAAWSESHAEWGPGLHEDGFGIGPHDEVESAAGFAAWVDRLHSLPARLWWIVEQNVVLGQGLRHAREAGLERVLVVCLDDNAASIKVIERHGGALQRTADDGQSLVRHYWIDL